MAAAQPAQHHSPLGLGDQRNVGLRSRLCPRHRPPLAHSHCWLYAGLRALNSLAPAACWHWLYSVQWSVQLYNSLPCTVLHWTHLAATDIINTSGLCTEPSTKANLNKKRGCISTAVKVNTCNTNFFSREGTSEYFSHPTICNIIYCNYSENIFVCKCREGGWGWRDRSLGDLGFSKRFH